MAKYKLLVFSGKQFGSDPEPCQVLRDLGHEVHLVQDDPEGTESAIQRARADLAVFCRPWQSLPQPRQVHFRLGLPIVCLDRACSEELASEVRDIPAASCAVWPCSREQLQTVLETALRRSRTCRGLLDLRRAEALDHLPIGVLTVGPDLRIEMANRHACRELGLEGRTWRGDNIETLLDVRPVEGEIRTGQHPVVQAIRSGQTHEQEVYLQVGSGPRRRSWLQIRPLPASGQNPPGVLVMLLSGFASDYGQLGHSGQSYHLVGQMSTGIAHHYNNLLTVIEGYGRLLQQDLQDRPQAVEATGHILSAAHRAAQLTRQLMEFSRKRIGRPRHTDIHQSITETVDMLRPMLPDSMKIRLDLSAEACNCWADPAHVREIWANLIFNARDAMEDQQGVLTISTRILFVAGEESRVLEIVFADDGVGMDEQTRARAFDPFFSTKPLGQGTGLGLSTVFYHIQQISGQIEIRSGRGQGTRMVIQLPLESDEAEIESPEAQQPDCRASESLPLVAIVDDEPGILRLGRGLLEREGYRTECYSAVAEAISAFQQDPTRWDAVVLDLVLSDGSGLDLLRWIRSLRADLPVLMTSGCDSGEIRSCVEGIGSVEVMAKPWPPGRLPLAIRGMLIGEH